MKLSVIIVNYNVRAYLEQCLRTVQQAMRGIDGDVFVVDNLSTDGSVEMVREKFPQVRVIANQDNVGFSRANNQAIKESSSEYVVLLNPDTVVGEDVFSKVIAFLDAHPKAGGLGVKMIDGTGRFLPESKRGLPTPSVAFYKIIGLTRLFPRSKVFGRYHLGHLPENETAPIEILSGACMFLRKKTLDEVGLLDESFFMYGEDIDLSYRITLGGYENWYFPKARIIHYKGESTKKSSVNYVFVFYNAMAIFARKHFTRKRPDVFSSLINGAIYLSAAGAIIARFLRRALLPVLDFVFTMGLTYLLDLWRNDEFVISHQEVLVGSMWITAISIVTVALFGAYDRPVRLMNIVRGMFVLVSVAVTVQLLRGEGWTGIWPLIAEGTWITVCFLVVRYLIYLLRIRGYSLRDQEDKRILAIGTTDEARRALSLLWQTHFGLGRQEHVLPEEVVGEAGTKAVRKMLRRRRIDEVVFCARDMEWGRIIELMERLKRSGAEFKIAQPGQEFIIGPSSIESLQDLHIMEWHAVNSASGRRSKRIVDVAVALLLFATLPIALLFIEEKVAFLGNWWQVLIGNKSWVGYHAGKYRGMKLPAIKSGILDPVTALRLEPLPIVVDRVNITYAKDYSAWHDVRLVIRGFGHLGGGQ